MSRSKMRFLNTLSADLLEIAIFQVKKELDLLLKYLPNYVALSKQ